MWEQRAGNKAQYAGWECSTLKWKIQLCIFLFKLYQASCSCVREPWKFQVKMQFPINCCVISCFVTPSSMAGLSDKRYYHSFLIDHCIICLQTWGTATVAPSIEQDDCPNQLRSFQVSNFRLKCLILLEIHLLLVRIPPSKGIHLAFSKHNNVVIAIVERNFVQRRHKTAMWPELCMTGRAIEFVSICSPYGAQTKKRASWVI